MDFTPAERKVYRSLKTPFQIQKFLDETLAYNDSVTSYSPRLVLKHGVAHCMEGALFAATALRQQGHPALIVDLEAERDDDHVLAVYRVDGHWGALAKSNYAGLRSREPVYRTIRELVMSYFDHYYNLKGEKSLRAHSRPVNLARFDAALQWMTTDSEVWEIPTYLCEIAHTPVAPPAVIKRVAKMDRRLFEAGKHGMKK